MSSQSDSELSRKAFDRRSFLKGAGGAAAGSVLAANLAGAASAARAKQGVASIEGGLTVTLNLNGADKEIPIEPRTTLLSALRDRLSPAMTGTKLVCDEGACGACTVLVDGEPRNACITLAVDVVGSKIRTVEGLSQGGELSPLQEAFCKNDALMCGFCTPGFLMSLTGELEQNPGANVDDIRKACSGNLCRCGTYPFIFQAAAEAGAKLREKGGR